MARGISIASPIRRSSEDGFFQATTTALDTAKSNLRNLLLTAKGERLMHPDYGLSPKSSLFENRFDKEAYKDMVHNQVARFLPYILIKQINIKTQDDDSLYINKIYIKLWFALKDYENVEDFIDHLF